MAQPEPNSTFAFVIEGFGLTFISIIGFIGNIYAIRLIQKRFNVSLIDEIFLSPAAIQKLTDKRYENNMYLLWSKESDRKNLYTKNT